MDLVDGETCEMKGSGAKPYVLKNTGGVYSCTCPAWRNQSVGIERRTCKHLKKLRGEAAEAARLGESVSRSTAPSADAETGTDGAPAEGKAPPLLLAHSWENDVDLTGWWMSEKLDGVRAYWDGRRFISRLGNEFIAPRWFVAAFPDIPLDGELWGGRKRFQRTVSIARRQDAPQDWSELAFLVFDAPAVTGAFEKRIDAARTELRERLPKFARLHEHVRCDSVDHLKRELRARHEGLGGGGPYAPPTRVTLRSRAVPHAAQGEDLQRR